MRIWISMLLTFACCQLTYAQFNAHFRTFTASPIWNNPACAGYEESNTVAIGYRDQWIGFEGAPNSTWASYDHYLASISSGLGLTMMHETVGLYTTTALGIPYSYIFAIKDSVKFIVGAQVSVTNFILDGTQFSPFKGGTDPTIPTDRVSWSDMGFTLGTWLTVKNFNMGVSARHIANIALKESSFTTSNYFHTYVTVGYRIKASETINWEPTILVHSSPLYTGIDIMNVFDYNKKFRLGLSYYFAGKTVTSISGFLGAKIYDKLDIMTAYEYDLGGLRGFNQGSLELIILYQFKSNTKKSK